MSVKDDALTAVHNAMLAVQTEAATLATDLAAAEAAVAVKGKALTQSQALAEALAAMHALGTGATAVAPVAASAWTKVKTYGPPVGALAAMAGLYAHYGLKLF